MRNRHRIRTALALVALCTFAVACHGDHILPERTTTRVTEDGGEAVSPDGTARLVFPAGAVEGSLDITVEIVRDQQIAGLRSVIYQLGPSGVAFDTPVQLEVQVDGQATSGRLAIAKVFDGVPAEIAGSVHDAEAGVVTAGLESFSFYGVFDFDEAWDPCGGKSCGDTCQICPPDDPECIETTVIKYCQPDGECAPSMPTCKPEPIECEGPNPQGCTKDADCGSDEFCNHDFPMDVCIPSRCECDEDTGTWICTEDCGGGICTEKEAAYDPCEGLACGDVCTVCAPDDPDCAETTVIKQCNADGECTAGSPACDGAELPEYDPCGGKACGDSCQICAPWDTGCNETTELKACDAHGACRSDTGTLCAADDAAYDPCAGKACGEICTLCDPNDPDCAETTVVKYCDARGACGALHPSC